MAYRIQNQSKLKIFVMYKSRTSTWCKLEKKKLNVENLSRYISEKTKGLETK